MPHRAETSAVLMSNMLKRAVLNTFRAKTTDELAACLSVFGRREWISNYRWLDSSGIALYFLDRLKALDIAHILPVSVLEHLEKNQAANKKRIANLFAEFVAINRKFQLANIIYFNVKGFASVPIACPDPVLRVQINLDFVISASDAASCYKALAELSYSLISYSEDVWEFGVGAEALRSLDIYEITPPRTVKIYVVSPGKDSHRTAYQQLLRIQSQTWNGFTFPVASDSDAFINQSIHIFGRICSEWTRLSWLLEYKACVDFRRDDATFLRNVQQGAQNNPDRVIAIGVALSLIKMILGAVIPPSLEEWTILKLDGSINLWIRHYGEEALLAGYPGTKRYLYLRDVLASNQRRRSSDSIKAPPLPSSFRPDDISLPRGLRHKSHITLLKASRKIFRVKFHVMENARNALSTRHWKRLLSRDAN
jgi:hypothetical protein